MTPIEMMNLLMIAGVTSPAMLFGLALGRAALRMGV